jgi:hypothetical protein
VRLRVTLTLGQPFSQFPSGASGYFKYDRVEKIRPVGSPTIEALLPPYDREGLLSYTNVGTSEVSEPGPPGAASVQRTTEAGKIEETGPFKALCPRQVTWVLHRALWGSSWVTMGECCGGTFGDDFDKGYDKG